MYLLYFFHIPPPFFSLPIVNGIIYFLPLRYEDWWWKVALGKCYFRLGMLRCLSGCHIDCQPFLIQFSIHCNTSMPIGQGRREAVQVCNQTAANDRHLSHAGEGELVIFAFTFFVALISSFSSLSCFTLGQLVFFTFTFLFYIWSIGFLIKGLSEAGPTHRCLGGEMRKRTKSDFFHWHPFFSFSSSCVPCKLHPVLGVQNWSWLLSKRSYPPGESSWSETSQVLLQILLQGGSCKSARGSWQSRPLCQVSKI